MIGMQGEDANVDAFFDRTERIYAGIKTGVEGERVFHLVSQGEYPKNLLGFVFSKQRGFVRKQKPYSHWENIEEGIRVASAGSGYLLISNGDAESMFSGIDGNGYPFPSWVQEGLENSALAVYVPYVKAFSELSANTQLPILPDGFGVSSLFVVLFPGDASTYRLTLVLGAESEQDAQAFVSLGKLLLLKRAKEKGNKAVMSLMHDVTIAAEGNSVRVEGLILHEDEVKSLIGMVLGGMHD